MKIRIWDRLALFLGGLAAMLAGAFQIAQCAQLLSLPEATAALPAESAELAQEAAQSVSLLPELSALTSHPGWLWGGIALGAVMLLLGVYLLVFPRRFAYCKHAFVTQQIENGELRIAVKALENLVQKCIDMHPEIHLVSMYIHNARDGVVVELRISLANNISIPLAVASLQKQIKQYLVASSGIDVKEVRVSVETAEDAAAESPYLVSNEPNGRAPVEKAEPQPAPKPALHRRIFGRGDQSAPLPEAPAPAEAPQPVSETPAEPAPEQAEPAQEAAPQEPAAPELTASEPAEESNPTPPEEDANREDTTHA